MMNNEHTKAVAACSCIDWDVVKCEDPRWLQHASWWLSKTLFGIQQEIERRKPHDLNNFISDDIPYSNGKKNQKPIFPQDEESLWKLETE